MNTARGPGVPTSLFVWKVRLWLLAIGLAIVVNDEPTPATHGQQARAPADLIACTVPSPVRQLMQRASQRPQAEDCARPDFPADPADL